MVEDTHSVLLGNLLIKQLLLSFRPCNLLNLTHFCASESYNIHSSELWLLISLLSLAA